jgi:hypothetical protein
VRRLSLALAALALGALPWGGTTSRASPHAGLVLLSFLDLTEESRPGERGSRSQAVFLRSMATQHPRLRVLLVDVSGSPPSEQRNRIADWHLDGLSVVGLGVLGEVERGWFTGRPPETLLVREPDTVLRRWMGFASAAQLDLALRAAADRTAPRRR